MADLKISELTNLTAADPANDMIPIVDVSATPPASGSTKRISINNILACSPTATLASATISGDLTVDTSTLKVDSANNRVGIGTASPGFTLDVQSAAGTIIRTKGGSGSGQGSAFYITAAGSASTLFAFGDRANIFGGTPDVTASIYTGSGIPLTFDVGASTAMTLNSTGLGVGASPAYKFHVAGSANDLVSIYSLNTNNNASIATSNALKLGYTSTVGTHFATFKITEDGVNDNSAGLTIDLPFGGVESTKVSITSSGSFIIGTAAVATTATDGFLYVTGCAGTPTGTPTAKTGRVPIVVDTTNNKLYFYSGGSWVAAN